MSESEEELLSSDQDSTESTETEESEGSDSDDSSEDEEAPWEHGPRQRAELPLFKKNPIVEELTQEQLQVCAIHPGWRQYIGIFQCIVQGSRIARDLGCVCLGTRPAGP